MEDSDRNVREGLCSKVTFEWRSKRSEKACWRQRKTNARALRLGVGEGGVRAGVGSFQEERG